MRCTTCNGTGEMPDSQTDCDAELALNAWETVTCWGIAHEGPHAAIQCEPCPICYGFDEHAETCEIVVRRNAGTITDDEEQARGLGSVSAWLQWDDEGTFWFVPGGNASKQPENIRWRGLDGALR